MWTEGELKAFFQWRQAANDKNNQNKETNIFLRTEALLATVGEYVLILG